MPGSMADARQDETLAGAAKGGSEAAFEELVRRYEGRLHRFLRSRTTCADDARDLTQQTFVAAYRSLDRFDARRPFSPWLFTIARRQLVNYYRARARDPVAPQEIADSATPVDGLVERETEAGLWSWTRAILSASQYEVLWLQLQEDCSVEEIAAATGKTQTHVKVLLHRARRKLIEWVARRGIRGRSAELREHIEDSMAGRPVGFVRLSAEG